MTRSGSGGESAGEEDALLAALLRIHRTKRQRQREREGAPNASYERILGHFAQRGDRLRGEKLVTAELIERLFEAGRVIPARRVQQELNIVGGAGSRAAGRLRLANRSATRARFEFVVGDPLEGGSPPRVVFEPHGGELDPGETRLVRVEADLGGWREGDAMTIPVECRWDKGRDRLWLDVSALPLAREGDR